MTAPTYAAAPARAEFAGAARAFRPEIQGLRALAVMSVLLYHLWANRITGGYVGVDVFFVVSGYLITAHLLAEIARTGTVRVTAFWARRIRRLLPASFLVLVVSMIVVIAAVPEGLKARFARDIGAAAAYVVNWVFAGDSVDYLAQDDSPSIVQHYWSLSVEEQFYVVWPLLLIGAIWLVRDRVGARARTLLLLVVGVLLASIAASVLLTAVLPGPAYFNTGVRGWEFLAGAMVATLSQRFAAVGGPWRHRRLGAVLAWLGIALILVAVFRFDDATPFPGIAALLPVTGTALAIAAGANAGPLSLRRFSTIPVIRMLGDWSYSIYLWHWPLIVLFPLVTLTPVTSIVALGIVVVSIVFGALFKRFVEDPLRRPWAQRPRREFLIALVVPLVLIATAITTSTIVTSNIAAAAAAVAEREASPCFGARSTQSDDCGDPFLVADPLDTAYASTDLDSANWCLTQLLEDWRTCVWGDAAGPNGTMAFVGDSHAAAMVPAMDEYFSDEGWRVESFFRFGCPGLSSVPIEIGWPQSQVDSCATWSSRVLDEILDRDDISVVVFTDFTWGYEGLNDDPGRIQQDDVARTWSRLIAAGKTIVWVDDIPITQEVDIPTCLASIDVPVHGPCSLDRESAITPTGTRVAAIETPGVRTVDLSDLFCDDATCYSVVGGVVAYADNNHISNTFARSISPYLGARVLEAIEADRTERAASG